MQRKCKNNLQKDFKNTVRPDHVFTVDAMHVDFIYESGRAGAAPVVPRPLPTKQT